MDDDAKFWFGPNGSSMPADIFAAFRAQYPDKAEGWQPLFTREQVAAQVAAERERWRGLVVEMFEMADNWPAIAYSDDLCDRVQDAIRKG